MLLTFLGLGLALFFEIEFHYTAQVDFIFDALLPQIPKCHNYRFLSSSAVCVLGMFVLRYILYTLNLISSRPMRK